MKALVLYILMVTSICFSKPIDTTLVRKMDVTGDGKPDSILLHFKSKSFTSPFSWSIVIKSRGEMIYQFVDDGVALEDRFRLDDASKETYRRNKWNYFFQEFAEFKSGKDPKYGGGEMDEAIINSVAANYLRNNCKLSN